MNVAGLAVLSGVPESQRDFQPLAPGFTGTLGLKHSSIVEMCHADPIRSDVACGRDRCRVIDIWRA